MGRHYDVGSGSQEALVYLMQNSEYWNFLAPNLNFATTNLIHVILWTFWIIFKKRWPKYQVHVAATILLVTGCLFTSVTITTLEMIGIVKWSHFEDQWFYIPTLTDDWSSPWITTKCTFLTRILRVCLTKVKSWIKVNHKRTLISFFFFICCDGWWF